LAAEWVRSMAILDEIDLFIFIEKSTLRKYLVLALFIPVFSFAQTDCDNIKKSIEAVAVTFKSPNTKWATVIKQFKVNTFFALHFHFNDEHSQYETMGASVEFEDGTILKNESVKVDCKQEITMVANSRDANGTSAQSGKYLLQGFFPIDESNIEKFSSRKITRIQLGDVSKKIRKKDAESLTNYIQCMKDQKP
jgi:hypothetical protein